MFLQKHAKKKMLNHSFAYNTILKINYFLENKTPPPALP